MRDGTTESSPVVPRMLSPRRLEAYSDGVFSIAATLLVLDLSVDALGLGKHPTSEQVWWELGQHWQSFSSFGISFLLLGLLWSIHVHEFAFVERVDNAVLTLNTFRLLGVVLVPFTTTLTDGFSDTVPGRFLLALNFCYIITVGFIQWWYVSSPSRGMTPNMSDEYRALSRRNAFMAMVISAVVAVAAIWIGSFAFLLFLVSNAFDAMELRRAKREPGRRGRSERRAAHDSPPND
jgi:uncharacterized membrane protein